MPFVCGYTDENCATSMNVGFAGMKNAKCCGCGNLHQSTAFRVATNATFGIQQIIT
jgi:hypothetical protein